MEEGLIESKSKCGMKAKANVKAPSSKLARKSG